MDSIELRGLRAYGRHGANPGERDVAQPFDLDVVVDADLSRARASDELADTLDYDRLAREIRALVGATSFVLMERLADACIAHVMRDPRVVRASVRVAKPRLLDGATPAVTVRSERAGA